MMTTTRPVGLWAGAMRRPPLRFRCLLSDVVAAARGPAPPVAETPPPGTEADNCRFDPFR